MRQRTLLVTLLSVLVLLSASGFAYFCFTLVRDDTPEARAVRVIEKAGGKVIRFDKKDDQPVAVVYFSSTEITDDIIGALLECKQLQVLKLSNCKGVTNTVLKRLGKCRHLQTLELDDCKEMTDLGVIALSRCKWLRSLNLRGCIQVSDKGVSALADCKRLRSLILIDCNLVTPVGIAELRKAIPQLKVSRGGAGDWRE